MPIPLQHTLNDRRAYVFLVCLSFAVLFMQLSHPALHPLEVINAGADWQHACPLSHATAALFIAIPLLVAAGLSLDRLQDPLPWLGHSRFIHLLAPRPPPAQPL
jgi:hypothetical protein